ncbi:MAG: hypothetical protein QW165_01460 [Candidatus Woesearchaeota archaeon]
MRITIDTKTDSKDEIRKAIKLLMGLVGHEVYTNEPEKPVQQNIFDSPSPAVPNLMSMFDSAPSTPEQAPPEEKKEDFPQVEFY